MKAGGWRIAVSAIVPVGLVIGVGILTIQPGISQPSRDRLVAKFDFATLPANAAPSHQQSERAVAPALEHIRAWISAVGAAVGLTDLRGLGRPADLCLVDPRADTVTIKAVPGSGTASYPSFQLRPTGLSYTATMAPMGCVPADVNADGAIDVLVYYWGRSPVVFLGAKPDDRVPTAADFVAHELVNPMQVWNTTALNVADLDGSGRLAVIVGNYFPDGARVLDPNARADSLMAMQEGMGLARNAGSKRILLLSPTGRPAAMPAVSDHSDAIPAAARRGWTLAIGMQDLTGTGLPSMYLANDFGPDNLLLNCSSPYHLCFRNLRANRTMTQPKSKVFGHDSFKGMGVAFSYAGGNALPNIFVSNITSEWALQESNFFFVPRPGASTIDGGSLPYTDDSEALGLGRSGWSWDVKAGDFDNSGSDEFVQAQGFVRGGQSKWAQLQELAMANPDLLKYPTVWPNVNGDDDLSGHDQNKFYARSTDAGRYTDISADLGLDQPGVSRGFAIGDVNGDGQLDMVVANQWANSNVLVNKAQPTHPGVNLQFVRRTAAGAWTPVIGVGVRLAAGDGLPVQQAQLYPANGHAGVSAAQLHFAAPAHGSLGATVSWRDAGGFHHAQLGLSAGNHTIELNSEGRAVLR